MAWNSRSQYWARLARFRLVRSDAEVPCSRKPASNMEGMISLRYGSIGLEAGLTSAESDDGSDDSRIIGGFDYLGT